jgi:hypothetical protein
MQTYTLGFQACFFLHFVLSGGGSHEPKYAGENNM